MFRKALFWAHLICGVGAGLVILMMSVTGVILTYERQILSWEDRVYFQEPEAGQTRLPINELLALGTDASFTPTSVALYNEASSPLVLRAGRSGSRYLNPYTGEVYSPHSEALDNFFSTVTGWHRWFNMTGDDRARGRAITGISNLMFLFLVVSGLYLWLPGIYRWSTMRLRLWFHPNAKTGAARDFNWHHVFGFWAAIPLLVIVATATVFNYSWANAMVYRLAGEEPPQRRTASEPEGPVIDIPVGAEQRSYDELFRLAGAHRQDWRLLTMTLPEANAATVSFSIDGGNGGQPQKRDSLTLNAYSGAVVEDAPFTSLSAGRQARSWVRFLHTGEALGLIGQTLAGLASFAAVLMVWTGLALALRRFRGWLLRQRRTRTERRSAFEDQLGTDPRA